VLPALAESSPLSTAETTALYEAMLADVCRAVELSGADLLVNYRPDEQTPDAVADSEAAVRDAVAPALERPDDARFEVQVGSTFAARVGNTITHLLDREGVATAAAVEPTAAFIDRPFVDSAAMKLRSSEVVLGPATDGRVTYAGFADPLDFTEAYATPTIETLTDRALDEDYAVDYLPMLPVVETGSDLLTAVTQIRARLRAGRAVPAHTAARIEEWGLRVADGPELVRE
jgi:hypothetical protein